MICSENTPITVKMRNLFYLRSLDTPEASLCIQKCLSGDSVLLDHEVAYVLGQLRQPNSTEFLFSLASDDTAHEIVRHEAIEALGNFNNLSFIVRLGKFLTHSCQIIRESAILAIAKLSNAKTVTADYSYYGTHDPAYSFDGKLDDALPLFYGDDIVGKYQALFYLRDSNDEKAVEIIASGFSDPSDLFRHEIAFVFGQMQNEKSVPHLIRVLENPSEEEIVRHEAAEALGNIGSEECRRVLERYANSEVRILRESAQVGLGIADHADDYISVEML